MAAAGQHQNIFDGIDSETARLMLELLLSDVSELETSTSGKQREGESTDLEIAADIWKLSLETLQTSITDWRMTESIAAAVQHDGFIISQFTQEEQTAREDRALAHRLHGSDVTSDVALQGENLAAHILSKLAGTYVSEAAGEQLDANSSANCDESSECTGESSTWAAGRPRPDTRGLNRNCVACQEAMKYFDVIAAPCNHEYCRSCLRELFAAAMTDESLFPPRCCRRPITIGSVEIFLTKELKDTFEKKKVEFGTSNKTYCSSVACSAFLNPDQIEGDNGICPECFTSTCVVCKSESHEGECPADTALQAMLEMAEENNWQRCYSCRRMVELDHGCNHITCRCGAQFCYTCGAQWRTCGCDQWDEDRLLARANVVVQRDAPRLAIDNPVRIEQVEHAVRMLRERHNCAHTSWSYVRGPHQCEECQDHLPQYIFECRQCRIQACNRCRMNRL